MRAIRPDFDVKAPDEFFNEPYRTYAHGGPVLVHAAPEILGLSPEQIKDLQEVGLLPSPSCDPRSGIYTYDRRMLVLIRWVLHQKCSYSSAVDYWLQRNNEE